MVIITGCCYLCMVTDDEIQRFLTDMQSRHINGGLPPEYNPQGYTEALGVCRYIHARHGSSTYRIGEIAIHPELMRHPWLIKGVLWHEFAHHMEWQIRGTAGHGEHFRECYEKEPWYVLLNTLALLLIRI